MARRLSEAEQLLHQLARGLETAGAGERLGEPERAGEERSFGAGETVVTRVAANVGAVCQLAREGWEPVGTVADTWWRRRSRRQAKQVGS